MESALNGDNELFKFLDDVKSEIRSGGRPEQVTSPFGKHGITYAEDEDGEWYATIGFTAPDQVYAEIEDGTYGSLNGFRIYLADDEDAVLPSDVSGKLSGGRLVLPATKNADGTFTAHLPGERLTGQES